jgi:hypothetical protein
MKSASNYLLATAAFIVLFQTLWFGPECLHQIDYDGMAYTGIARHLRDGDFHLAINAFRSPLLSWIIAALPGRNFVLTGKVVNISSFLACAVLLYVFTERLWRSSIAASAAVLMFVLGRGFIPAALDSIVPDFLFSALTLVYFIVLLRCVQGGAGKDWLALGSVQGIAYFAKAFGLPWFAVTTIVAVLLVRGTPKQRLARFVAAALIPIVCAGAWAMVLHSKYGVLTTGSQFKTNLLQWTLGAYRDHPDPTYAFLRDTTNEVDTYMVDDPMPPGSWPWTYRISMAHTLPQTFVAEERNIPAVLKEIIILITPGGLLAFIAVVVIIARRKVEYPVQWQIAVIIMVAAASLVIAYSMLVFDSRYLYPLVPLLLAVASRFLVNGDGWNHDWPQRSWRLFAIALVIVGEIVALAYPSSPFRRITRDFQSSCYAAADRLKAHARSTHEEPTLASIGSGPFPEHGVGWEAGYKAAFFANRKLIAASDALPSSAMTQAVLTDLDKASPGAILIWGSEKDATYANFMNSLSLRYPDSSRENIVDPVLGDVGAILFLKPTQSAAVTSTVARLRRSPVVECLCCATMSPRAAVPGKNREPAGRGASRLLRAQSAL